MKYAIGVDLGTSAVKLILTDENGAILRTVSKSYPLLQPKPHWSEQNPEDWWNGVCSGIEELTADIDKTAVRAVGVGGQMHGLVMLDKDDRVLRPAILWNDTRTGKETDWLNSVIGKERLQALTGNIAFAGFTAPKILWVKENEPALFARCSKLCLPKDYINYRLTGVFATDVSDASGTLFFDVAHRCWSKEMLGVLGITEAMLPAVYESEAVIGRTTALGLCADVAAGAGDNAAAAIGTDTVRAGQCNISLGTSGTVFLPTDSFVQPDNPALHSFCHANGKWHLMGCILSAASCNQWLNERVLQSGYDVKAGDPSNELYFMPYLSGERCPHNDGDVRGAFLGLTHATTREDLQTAVFEGVSFAIKDCLALCPAVSAATVCGGGTRSDAWMQILADVLHLELHVIDNEGPAYGGALLALGLCHTPRVKAVITPNAETAAIYEQKYRKYRQLYPMLKDFYRQTP